MKYGIVFMMSLAIKSFCLFFLIFGLGLVTISRKYSGVLNAQTPAENNCELIRLGDINCDGKINLLDLAIWKKGYLSLIRTNTAKVEFPKDHGEHTDFKNEWWYVNLIFDANNSGNLSEDDPTLNYAYTVSFSKVNSNIYGFLTTKHIFNNQINYQNRLVEFTSDQDTGGVVNGKLEDNRLKVEYANNSFKSLLQEIDSVNGKRRYLLRFGDKKGGGVELELTERTLNSTGDNEPLLWGCTGNISVFSPNDTYYYSVPDLDIVGYVFDSTNSRKKIINGKAWIDHQWFNSSPPTNWRGHYWNSFHYVKELNGWNWYKQASTSPHGAVGVLTQVYNDGPKYSYWVRRETDGTNKCGAVASFSIKNRDPVSGWPTNWSFQTVGDTNPVVNVVNSQNRSIATPQTIKIQGLPYFIENPSIFSGRLDEGDGGVDYSGVGFMETSIKQ